MPCEEWYTLLEHCYEAETACSQAITNPSGLVGTEFDDALQQADEARKVSQVAEKALLRHEHMQISGIGELISSRRQFSMLTSSQPPVCRKD